MLAFRAATTAHRSPCVGLTRSAISQRKHGCWVHVGPGCVDDVMNAPQLYTPAEAAEVLKVPESWLRKKAAARMIPCTFLGKHLRFSDEDISKIVRAGAKEPLSLTPRTRGRRGPRTTSREET